MPRALSKHISSTIENTTSDVHVCHEYSRNSNRARSNIEHTLSSVKTFLEQGKNFGQAQLKIMRRSKSKHFSRTVKKQMSWIEYDKLRIIRKRSKNSNRTRSKSLRGQTVRWMGAQFSICKSL